MSDLQAAETALRQAKDEYEDSRRDESMARSRATESLNRLNEAQKAFDKVIEAMRADAPIDSDWNRNR